MSLLAYCSTHLGSMQINSQEIPVGGWEHGIHHHSGIDKLELNKPPSRLKMVLRPFKSRRYGLWGWIYDEHEPSDCLA